ncbi:hypothetical protein [Pseudomonas synxantha]|nr:hypothetical protein [Pseudomonas synxantha]
MQRLRHFTGLRAVLKLFRPYDCRPQYSKQRRSNVGAGLPAKAIVQQQMQRLTHSLRGQARSHRGTALNPDWH